LKAEAQIKAAEDEAAIANMAGRPFWARDARAEVVVPVAAFPLQVEHQRAPDGGLPLRGVDLPLPAPVVDAGAVRPLAAVQAPVLSRVHGLENSGHSCWCAVLAQLLCSIGPLRELVAGYSLSMPLDDQGVAARRKMRGLRMLFEDMCNRKVWLGGTRVESIGGRVIGESQTVVDEDPWEQLEAIALEKRNTPYIFAPCLGVHYDEYEGISMPVALGLHNTTLGACLMSVGMTHRDIVISDFIGLNLGRNLGAANSEVSEVRLDFEGLTYDLGSLFRLPGGSCMYDVFAVWKHTGPSVKNGHWTSAQRFGTSWVVLDDARVGAPEGNEAFLRRLWRDARTIAGVWMVKSSASSQVGR
jgi:hypothetical protein